MSFKNVRNRLTTFHNLAFELRLTGRWFFLFSFLFYGCTHGTPSIQNACPYHTIMSFGAVNDLKTLESVCKLTNNSSEVKDIVAAISQGLKDIKLTIPMQRDCTAELISMGAVISNGDKRKKNSDNHKKPIRACKENDQQMQKQHAAAKIVNIVLTSLSIFTILPAPWHISCCPKTERKKPKMQWK